MLRRAKEVLPCRAWTNRSQRGLYAGRQVGFGNQISFSHRHTRRTWKPNVQKKTLYSELLDESFRINVTTTALRTIDKKGGLDNYVLYTRDAKLNSVFAMKLKKRLKEAYELKNGEKFRMKPKPERSVKDQWQEIISNYHRNKTTRIAASPASQTLTPSSPSPSTEAREQSELT